MLSRRSVRIKAMQLLFAVNRDEALSIDEAKKRYWGSIEDTYSMYLLNLYALLETCKVSTKDGKRRAGKHLPSDEDKAFKDKLYNNSLIKNLEVNVGLMKKIRQSDFAAKHASDYFENVYFEFAKSEEYKAYLIKESSNKDHLDILLELYRFCRKNEMFNDLMEDVYGTWADDKSVVIGSVKKTLKELPTDDDQFYQKYRPDDATVNEFGYKLFELTHNADAEYLKIIEAILKNWDSERLAIIDMILLKMALCEMLCFDTIPTKVTINEYVDIARLYSTAKSKEFINGILDKSMKSLEAEGKISKQGRGLQDGSK